MTRILLKQEQVIEQFRAALLNYLVNPSRSNRKNFINSAEDLHLFALKDVPPGSGTDEVGAKVVLLTDEALKSIKVSRKKIQLLETLQDTLNKETQFSIDSVINSVKTGLEKLPVSDDQYRILQSIYTLELDGRRLGQLPAGVAALSLSEVLLETTLQLFDGTIKEPKAKEEYTTAFSEAKNKGIESHRGLKEHVYNFFRLLSCILVVPIFFYAKQGTLWTNAKTKTQEDVEKAQLLTTDEGKITTSTPPSLK